jgi:hypothetical protein
MIQNQNLLDFNYQWIIEQILDENQRLTHLTEKQLFIYKEQFL